MHNSKVFPVSPELKKNINTASYILNAVLAVALVVVLFKSGPTPIDRAAQRIAVSERGQLPSRVSRMPLVQKVEITDVQITNHVEPYEGYMVTCWNCGEDEVVFVDTVYVPVKDIEKKGSDYSWTVDWDQAYMDMMAHSLGLYL